VICPQSQHHGARLLLKRRLILLPSVRRQETLFQCRVSDRWDMNATFCTPQPTMVRRVLLIVILAARTIAAFHPVVTIADCRFSLKRGSSTLIFARPSKKAVVNRQAPNPAAALWRDRLTASSAPWKVAIIGGGIAGLSCAQVLSKAQFAVTVYDTGRLRVGGRCASRRPHDPPKSKDDAQFHYLNQCILDHAVQMIILDQNRMDDGFSEQIELWLKQDIIRDFPLESLFTVTKSSASARFVSLNHQNSSLRFLFGTNGMASLPEAMVRDAGGTFDIRSDTWVSPAKGVRYCTKTGQWFVKSSDSRSVRDEPYDLLVIAHNGKCADRLLSQTPAVHVHRLLRVQFAPTATTVVARRGGPTSLPTSRASNKMTLNSIYSLTIAIQGSLSDLQALDSSGANSAGVPPTLIAGPVQNSPSISFVSSPSRKFAKKLQDDHGRPVEIWTILSTGVFGQQYKAAQEFLTPDTISTVSDLLVSELERVFGWPSGSVAVLERRLQLWGAAVPVNTYQGPGFLYDGDYAVGVCGDWLVESSVAGAWCSGRRLANHLVQMRTTRSFVNDVGLDRGAFVASQLAEQHAIAAMELA
jgi:predicted NAD/FAD-dependent oxidoreductase